MALRVLRRFTNQLGPGRALLGDDGVGLQQLEATRLLVAVDLMHIELAPPTDEPPHGELKDGAVIPLSSASTYPTTEQTLVSVSILHDEQGTSILDNINVNGKRIGKPGRR